MSSSKRSFLTGFTALFPAILTIFVVVELYKLVDGLIGRPVNAALKAQLMTNPGQAALRRVFGWPEERFEDEETLAYELDKRFPPVIGLAFGLLVSIVGIYVVGRVLTFLLGRKLFGLGERLMAGFPIVKVIYPHAKQLTDFIFSDKKLKVHSVVAVEYPRKGLYCLGFITNDGLTEVTNASGMSTVIVFVPSSPIPVSGYTIMVAREEVIPLHLTVDEAVRYFLTGGVVVPAHHLLRPGEGAPPALLPGGVEKDPKSLPTGKVGQAAGGLRAAVED